MGAYQCKYCHHSFKDKHALWQHTKHKHKGKKRGPNPLEQTKERSMADELVDAQISHAMGEPVDDWIMEMFPEQFDD